MLRVIGLMSGTSLDGVDAAGLVTDGIGIAGFGPALTIPYAPELRVQLRGLLERAAAGGLAADDGELKQATIAMTIAHAEAVRALGWPADLIGFHGQTLFHNPAARRTWQIGDAALLARLTGVRVAYDFRGLDVAAGGQGAPLVPLFHQALARDLPKPLAVLNLGGVGNLTWLGEDDAILACDTGPGNALIDDWVRTRLGLDCDRDGALARSGQVQRALILRWLRHEFFTRPAPKSLDRQAFAACLDDMGELSPQDGAATLAAFTAAAVSAARLPEPPRRWIVAGGGRRNPALISALRAALRVPVQVAEEEDWDGDALEAQAFGFLAARVLHRLPLSLPATTGVPRPMAGGLIANP